MLQKEFFKNQWNLSEEKIGTNFWNILYIFCLMIAQASKESEVNYFIEILFLEIFSLKRAKLFWLINFKKLSLLIRFI